MQPQRDRHATVAQAIRHTSRPRTFAWVRVRGARFYEVTIFQRDVEIFRTRTTAPRLVLPKTWRHGDETYRLQPGRYRWLVVPAFGPRNRPRFGPPAVSAALEVGR